jgi:replicative superfamily II helicase
LCNTGFILPQGAAGYKLTGLGEVTMNFLFRTFANYALAPFLELDKLIEKDHEIKMDHTIIHKMCLLFSGACLSKKPREKSEQVISFYENEGIHASDIGNSEYSAYAIFNGWMNNFDLPDIEERFKVYSSQCPQIAAELFKLLTVYEKLANKKGVSVPAGFKDFRDRVRFGVTEEELPLRRLRGIGRGTTRKIKMYCDNTLRKPPWALKGSILEILEEIYMKQGEKRFIEVLQYIKGVGRGKKHEKILNLVKTKTKTAN